MALTLVVYALIVLLPVTVLYRAVAHRKRIPRLRYWLAVTILPLCILFGLALFLEELAHYQYHQTDHQRALVAGMKTDLRNLVTAQEAFFSQNNDYAGAVTNGPQQNGRAGAGSVTFVVSEGNVLRLTYVRSTGWWAVMTNSRLDELPPTRFGRTCGIFIGKVTDFPAPTADQTAEGAPVCW